MNSPTSTPGRRRSVWRTAGWVVGSVLLLLVLFVLVSEALGWRYLRAPVERYATRTLGVPVKLAEPFALHVLRPPELKLGGLWVAAAPGSDAPFLVDARELALHWRWRDVMALRNGAALRVKGLEAGSIEAHLRRDAAGHASWQFKPPSESDPSKPPEWPQFDLLRLQAGSLHVDDKPLDTQVEVTFDINEVRTAAANNTAAGSASGFHLQAKGRYKATPLQARLTSPQVLPFIAEGGAPPVQVEARATVGRAHYAYDGTLTDLLGNRYMDGRFSVDGPSLGAVGEPIGVTLPSTPPFALHGRLTKNDPVWQAAIADATIGKSRLAGEFRYDPQPKVPKLSGSLRGKRLDLADLAPAVGAPAADLAAAKPVVDKTPGRVLPDKQFDLPSLKAMNADVTVALDELDLSTTALDPLRPLKAHVLLTDGVLRIEDLDARTAGGSVAGMTQLDSASSPPKWQADLRWRGIDLAGWLKGARKDTSDVKSTSGSAKLKKERTAARKGDAPVTAYITGELQGSAKLSGQGQSTAQILGTLNGQAQATVRDGTLSHLVIELLGIDIAQSLGVWISGDESLPLHCAAVAVDVKKGDVTPRVAVFDTSVTTINVNGTVDLTDEKLDLRAVVKPKNFSFAALRSPLHVSGTFAQPKPRVEVLPIAARVAAATALAFVNPFAAILPLFDPGDDPGDGCRALASQAKSAQAKAGAENR